MMLKTSATAAAKAKELHKYVRQKFKTRRIIVKGIDHIWAADLLVMSGGGGGAYKYILNVIDCFSKYVWSVALKKKNAAEVCNAFKKFLKNSGGRKPQLLHTDRGKEFVNSSFEKLLKKFHIKMYHTFSEVKSSIVERFNRTMNEKLKLQFEINQNHKWLNILPEILRTYNEKSVHRTIGMPPAMVNKKNEKEVYQRMYPIEKFKLEKPTFIVGDRVRLSRKKKHF